MTTTHDRHAEDICRRYGLRQRTVPMLAALLRRAGTGGWTDPVARADLAADAAQTIATARRALSDLRRAGVVIARGHRAGGTPRSYRVVAVAPGAPGVSRGEPGQGSAPPPHTIPPRDRWMDRWIDPSIHQSRGVGAPADLPPLPAGCWSDPEAELPERLADYADRHTIPLDGSHPLLGRGMTTLLGAVLAARDAEPVHLRGYVAACLRRGVADGYLARADRLLRGIDRRTGGDRSNGKFSGIHEWLETYPPEETDNGQT